MDDNFEQFTMYDKNLRSISTTSVSGVEITDNKTFSNKMSEPYSTLLRIELVKILTPVVYKEHPSYSREEFAEDVVGIADAILEQLQKDK